MSSVRDLQFSILDKYRCADAVCVPAQWNSIISMTRRGGSNICFRSRLSQDIMRVTSKAFAEICDKDSRDRDSRRTLGHHHSGQSRPNTLMQSDDSSVAE